MATESDNSTGTDTSAATVSRKDAQSSVSPGRPREDRPESDHLEVHKPDEVQTTDDETSKESMVARRSGRFWVGVLIGGVITLPFAWLLSYAAALPFFLGLFFFMLFGLVIGASVHRAAAGHGPFGRRTVLLGTTLLVLWCWGLSIVKEGRDFPAEKAGEASQSTLDIGDRTRAEYEAKVADSIRAYFRDHYPPGGPLGYIRWVISNGEIKRGDIADVRKTLSPMQRRWVWMARAMLSVCLLAFGIGSQTFGLRVVARSGESHSGDPMAVET